MERRLVEECSDNRRVGLLPCGSWPENSKWRRGSPFGLDPTQGLKESRHRLGCVLAGNEEGVRGLEVGDGPQLVNGLAPDNPSSIPDLPRIYVKQLFRVMGFCVVNESSLKFVK